MATNGGSPIRLRASCNACNESKVRCSQRKPTCARCKRNDTACIYGLSRRTHKDAPPISMPSSQRARMAASRSPPSHGGGDTHDRNHSHRGSWAGLTFPKSASATSSKVTSPGDAARTLDTGYFGDFMSGHGPHFMMPPPQPHDSAIAAAAAAATPHFHMYTPTLDFSSPVAGSSGTTPTPGHEYAHSASSLFGSGSGSGSGSNSSDGGAVAGTDPASFWARQMTAVSSITTSSSSSPLSLPPSPLSRGDCTCHAGVTGLLMSMPGGGDDRRLSLDAQLAKLKRCIVSSEKSMECAHGPDDAEPIHLMAIVTLIGYVMDEFQMLARDSPWHRSLAAAAAADEVGNGAALRTRNLERSKSTSTTGPTSTSGPGSVSSMSTPNSNSQVLMGGIANRTSNSEPRLSWGVLELEEDDEIDLRQRLYLLSFRKLERLLSQLTLHLRSLHDARTNLPDPSRYMAFVMACDYTRLWLEKKAEDVKKMFSVSARNEKGDQALA